MPAKAGTHDTSQRGIAGGEHVRIKARERLRANPCCEVTWPPPFGGVTE